MMPAAMTAAGPTIPMIGANTLRRGDSEAICCSPVAEPGESGRLRGRIRQVDLTIRGIATHAQGFVKLTVSGAAL